MTAADTTVSFAPWVAFLKPYLDMLVSALIAGVIIPLLSYAVWRVTGITVDKRYSDQLTKLLTNAAAGIVAAGAARVSVQGVDVHHADLKEAADKIIGFAPNAVAHFSLTPQDIADRIVQKIPQLPTAQAPAI